MDEIDQNFDIIGQPPNEIYKCKTCNTFYNLGPIRGRTSLYNHLRSPNHKHLFSQREKAKNEVEAEEEKLSHNGAIAEMIQGL